MHLGICVCQLSTVSSATATSTSSPPWWHFCSLVMSQLRGRAVLPSQHLFSHLSTCGYLLLLFRRMSSVVAFFYIFYCSLSSWACHAVFFTHAHLALYAPYCSAHVHQLYFYFGRLASQRQCMSSFWLGNPPAPYWPGDPTQMARHLAQIHKQPDR